MTITSVSKTEIHIGNRILMARLLRGFSHESLAEELGVTPIEVQKYEQGEGLTGHLCALAQVLNVDASYFCEGLKAADSDDPTPRDGRYGILKRALQHIAADHVLTSNGYRKRLSREEAIRIAREACEALGWDYSKASVSKQGST